MPKEDNDNKNIPSGENQFMLGWNDAEHLENIMPGLAESFLYSPFSIFFHKQYILGFEHALKQKLSPKQD